MSSASPARAGTSTENFGWVQELRGRYVVVRDRDGIEMLVPNQQLISERRDQLELHRPAHPLEAAGPGQLSDDDPELALQDAAATPARASARVLRDPPPVSRLMQFGDTASSSSCASGSPIRRKA